MTSKEALTELAARIGDQSLLRLVSMKGYEGEPQPAEWEVIIHDPQSPTLLSRFRIGYGYLRREGQVEDLYPAREPAGFIDYAKLRLDSQGAFTIAEAAALQARMGFDSLNLTLRCREYSREPVWILHLINDEGLLVGKVHISANTGLVFRTIWIYRDELRGGQPNVVDSALLPPQPAPVENNTSLQPTLPKPSTESIEPTLPRGSTLGDPPPTIPIVPGATFVPQTPSPQIEREPVPTTTLPPIPPQLLQESTVPDTRIPPPPVPVPSRGSDGD